MKPFKSPQHVAKWTCALLFGISLISQPSHGQDGNAGVAKLPAQAAATFNQRCTACHTFGNGIKVGPDLKGVTERRKRDWLVRFIASSSSVIRAGDPTADALFIKFKMQRMPDWADLSEDQINALLDYLAADGPDIKPLDERNAGLASDSEVATGRKLFYGETRIDSGAQSCSTCHNAQAGDFRGGSLGPDLAKVYERYQDKALTLFLKHPCFADNLVGPETHYLTAQESFALKAFLRQVDFKDSGEETRTKKISTTSATAVRQTPGVNASLYSKKASH